MGDEPGAKCEGTEKTALRISTHLQLQVSQLDPHPDARCAPGAGSLSVLHGSAMWVRWTQKKAFNTSTGRRRALTDASVRDWRKKM